jgi:hypothetical protein
VSQSENNAVEVHMGTFTVYGDIQSIVLNEHQDDVKDELITTLRDDHAMVTIIEGGEEKVTATFILYRDKAQQLFDWIKRKGFVS